MWAPCLCLSLSVHAVVLGCRDDEPVDPTPTLLHRVTTANATAAAAAAVVVAAPPAPASALKLCLPPLPSARAHTHTRASAVASPLSTFHCRRVAVWKERERACVLEVR